MRKIKYIRCLCIFKKTKNIEGLKQGTSFLTERRGNMEVRLLDNSTSVCEGGISFSTLAIPNLNGSPEVTKKKELTDERLIKPANDHEIQLHMDTKLIP